MAPQLLHYVVEFDDGTHFNVHIDPDDPSNLTIDGVDSDVDVATSPLGLVLTTGDGQRLPLTLRYEDGSLVAETADGAASGTSTSAHVSSGLAGSPIH